MKLQIFQVDAFTSTPFAGNPAAVVPLESWLPADTMQQIAAENNLAETAFFVKNGGRYDIRWFTPTHEIELCGHATLASAFVIVEQLKLETNSVAFHSHLSGALPVAFDGERYVLDFPSRPPAVVEPRSDVIAAIGKEPIAFLKGRDSLLVYKSEADVRSIAPNFSKLEELGEHGFIVTAQGDAADFVSRFFAPSMGVNEDPVTGSSHTNLIPYWAAMLGKEKLVARQVSQRGGELYCELAGDRVKIGGNAVLYLKGEIYVEAGELKSVGA